MGLAGLALPRFVFTEGPPPLTSPLREPIIGPQCKPTQEQRCLSESFVLAWSW